MRIGILQTNPVVGDLDGNADRLAEAARKLTARGAQLCVSGELALCGYPPRDLLLYQGFVRRAEDAVTRLARNAVDCCPLLVGGVAANAGQGRPVHNTAFLLRAGRVERTFHKTLLPTYDVFDEDRYFQPDPDGGANNAFGLDGLRIGVTICEDAWNDKDFWPRRRYDADPLERLAEAGADLVVNLSSSPFAMGKQDLRERMLAAAAAKLGAPLVYVNQAGGNDDLVFDGRSLCLGPDGSIRHRARAFAEDLAVFDTDMASYITSDESHSETMTRGYADRDVDDVLAAVVLGTRDYVHKSGFSSVVLGLSGGIDSALTAVVAAEALGPDNVLGVLMPSPHSSPGSVADSEALGERLGIRTTTLPIGPLMQGFDDALAGEFAGLGPDVTEENIQARIRGVLLMALSNKSGSLLLTTGNKSELAVGYCTIYGDMAGAFAPISDLPKTLVYAAAERLNATRNPPPIPRAIIDKPPSAELRPGQTDQDNLPPYEVLDAVLALHVEHHLGVEELVARGFERTVAERVTALVRGAEFKRRQAPPGVKISERSFGTGWRMPLACRREL